MIRVGCRTYGTGEIVMDTRFGENLEAADKAGLKTGVYFFSQAVNARLNLTCEGITSAKKLADIKRYGCLEGRGEHLYPMMSRSEYENLLSYPSID